MGFQGQTKRASLMCVGKWHLSCSLCIAGFHAFIKDKRGPSRDDEGKSIREVHSDCNSRRSWLLVYGLRQLRESFSSSFRGIVAYLCLKVRRGDISSNFLSGFLLLFAVGACFKLEFWCSGRNCSLILYALFSLPFSFSLFALGFIYKCFLR